MASSELFAQHGEVEEIGIEFKRAQHRAAQAAEAHLVEHKKRAAVRDLQQPPDGGRGVCCADMRDIGDDSQPAAAVSKIGLDQSMAI